MKHKYFDVHSSETKEFNPKIKTTKGYKMSSFYNRLKWE